MKKRNLKLIALGLTGLMGCTHRMRQQGKECNGQHERIHFHGRSDGCTFGTVSEG